MLAGRGRASLAFAVAAIAAVAVAVATRADAQSPAGVPQLASVETATTGNDSEIRESVPIAERGGGERRVVMSMRPGELPNLQVGDRLDASSELQVTVDCRRRPRCVGRPYRYSPKMKTELLLADGEGVTEPGPNAVSLGRTEQRCLQGLPHREHHCVAVLAGPSIEIGVGTLPCAPANCRLNLVLDAHNRKAQSGDVLAVGNIAPNGDVKQDKGRINAVRLRPPEQPTARLRRTEHRLETGLSPRKHAKVVYSQRLRALEEGEQLDVFAKMRTGVGHLPYNALVTGLLVLTEGRHKVNPSGFVERVASLNGNLSERNGFNCVKPKTPCTTRKAGVLRMHEDARRDGRPVTLFANLVVYANAKRARPRPGDRVKVLPGGRLVVTRYPAELSG